MGNLPLTCQPTKGVVKNGKAKTGHQRYICRKCRKSFQLKYLYNANQPGIYERVITMTINGSEVRVLDVF
ncbi:MAG: IS1/IS1595 family N-terminal zinc-binding domain-containing protein [Endozoicomonas sp.]